MKWFSRLQDKRRDREDSFEQGTTKGILGTAFSMVLIIINGAFGLMHVFALRDAVMRFSQERFIFWTWRFIEASAAIIFSICWLVMVFVLQHLYEKDFRRSWLPIRFLIVLAVQIVLYYLTIWYVLR